MKTSAKGLTVGPAAVIAAVSSKLPGNSKNDNKKRNEGKDGIVQRTTSAVPETFGRLGRSVPGLPKSDKGGSKRAAEMAERLPRLLERAGAAVGVAAAGMELLREIRGGGSNGGTRSDQEESANPTERQESSSDRSRDGDAPRRPSSSRASTGGGSRRGRNGSASARTRKASATSSNRSRSGGGAGSRTAPRKGAGRSSSSSKATAARGSTSKNSSSQKPTSRKTSSRSGKEG